MRTFICLARRCWGRGPRTRPWYSPNIPCCASASRFPIVSALIQPRSLIRPQVPWHHTEWRRGLNDPDPVPLDAAADLGGPRPQDGSHTPGHACACRFLAYLEVEAESEISCRLIACFPPCPDLGYPSRGPSLTDLFIGFPIRPRPRLESGVECREIPASPGADGHTHRHRYGPYLPGTSPKVVRLASCCAGELESTTILSRLTLNLRTLGRNHERQYRCRQASRHREGRGRRPWLWARRRPIGPGANRHPRSEQRKSA